MISIQCTQCQAVLEIDDAFAGGVCRCQYCGTIQTVPSHLKPSSTAAPSPYISPPKPAKALYKNKAAATGSPSSSATAGVSSSPSGLDELAQVVASSGLANSGLAGSGLRSSRLTREDAASVAALAAATEVPLQQPAKFPILPIALGGGAVVAVVVGIVLFMLLHGGNGPGAATDSSIAAPAGTPAFLGGSINGKSVVYVLDRANSLHDEFDTIRAATYQSISSLGPDHKFAVLLWNNGGDDVAFPADGMRSATTDQLSQLKDAIGEITSSGNSHLAGALELARSRNPAAIVLVTAKTSLEPDDADALAKFQDSTKGKIALYVYVIGSAGDNEQLKAAAKATDGQYRHFTAAELRVAVQ